MYKINGGRKLFYLAGAALLGGRIVFSSTANINSNRECRASIGLKNYFKGLGVALLGCSLN